MNDRAVAPIVDAHVHFWDLRNPDVAYDWLGPGTTHPDIGDIEGLKVSRFAASEFVAQSRFSNVTKAVHVGVSTNADPVAETRWLQSIADRTGFPQAIVAKCDLASSAAEETLERHMEHPNVRGVRDNGRPGSFDDARWRRNFARLERQRLVFCHEVGPRVDEAVRLIRYAPDVQVCVDHCGMPRSLDREAFETWRVGITALAALPSVTIKLSALGQWAGLWTRESVRPWIEACIEEFGPQRVVIGSNFPVDGLFAPYGNLMAAFRDLIADYSLAEQADMLGANAERIFRI